MQNCRGAVHWAREQDSSPRAGAMNCAPTNHSEGWKSRMDFKSLPKVELHLHFDCSLSYAVVSRLNPSITLEEYRKDFIAPDKCTNLVQVLSRSSNSIALMQTEEQLQLVTYDVFEQLQQENVCYAELRFAPLLHTMKGLSAEEV